MLQRCSLSLKKISSFFFGEKNGLELHDDPKMIIFNGQHSRGNKIVTSITKQTFVSCES